MKKCRFCAEDIQDAAIVCKHCGRDLTAGASSPTRRVAVTAEDPFAAYHAPIQGKKAGRLTFVGYLGIGVGVFFVFGAGLALTQARDGGLGAFVFALIGVGFSVASYLWARR